MTATEARENVARGAALLDQKRPGWAQQINISTLNLGSPCLCVLGQLYRSFTRGWVLLTDGVAGQARPFGFDISGEESATTGGLDSPYYHLLQDAWIEAIADRLVTGGRPESDREVQEARASTSAL